MATAREGEVQDDLMVTWAELPRSLGYVFCDRLQKLLVEAGFDRRRIRRRVPQVVLCAEDGRSVFAAGTQFRMHLIRPGAICRMLA
jgi:transposase